MSLELNEFISSGFWNLSKHHSNFSFPKNGHTFCEWFTIKRVAVPNDLSRVVLMRSEPDLKPEPTPQNALLAMTHPQLLAV